MIFLKINHFKTLTFHYCQASTRGSPPLVCCHSYTFRNKPSMAPGQVHVLTQIKRGWDRTSLRLLHVTIRERVEKCKTTWKAWTGSNPLNTWGRKVNFKRSIHVILREVHKTWGKNVQIEPIRWVQAHLRPCSC